MIKKIAFYACTLFVLLIVSASPVRFYAQDAKPEKKAKKGDDIAFPNTPQGAFQTFFLAMITQNRDKLHEAALPDKDLDVLLEGEKPPARVVDRLKIEIAEIKFRVFKPGDVVELPGGKKMTIKPSEVDETHAVIMAPGDPVPTRCVKLDGKWKLDASVIIAARLAANEAKRSGDTPSDDDPTPKPKPRKPR
jgi:hypothetical protein